MTALLHDTVTSLLAGQRERRLWAACDMDTGLWAELSRGGFTGIGTPEQRGGSGGDVTDLAAVVRTAGGAGACVPLVEHAWLAAWLLDRAGLDLPVGPVTAATGPVTLRAEPGGWRVTGALRRVPWARACTDVVVLADDGRAAVVPLAGCALTPGVNLAGEPRDGVRIDRVVSPGRVGRTTLGPHDLLVRGALGRVLQIDGAAAEVVRRSVRHVSERAQFGRPLAGFQAVQQRLAVLVREAALLHTGAQTCLLSGNDRELFVLDVAAASLNAAVAAGVVSAHAHQLHGAIGTTSECGLAELTLRIASWRHEYGTQRHWARQLAAACACTDPWDVVISHPHHEDGRR